MKRFLLGLMTVSLLLLVAAMPVLAGGEQEAPDSEPEATTTTAVRTGEYGEAPMLAEMVAAGELPPVDERLPEEPMVLEPFDSIGQYGESLMRVARGSGDSWAFFRLTQDGLVMFGDPNGQTIVPNVAKGYEVSEDGRTFTFFLRDGMKWSDGEPLTADDFVFWYEDVVLNEDLGGTVPSWFRSGGEPGVLEKVDDYTITMSFAEPHGLLLRYLAGQRSMELFMPKHYLSQFHADYVDADTLQEMVDDAGFETWDQLFADKNNYLTNVELPRHAAWVMTTPSPEPRWIATRNPYYFKVDPEGNQLPYLDEVIHDVVENSEVVALKAANGELDVQFRHMQFEMFTLLKQSEASGGYEVLLWNNDRASRVAIYPNMTSKDPLWRELMSDIRFREALSIAIDRSELNEIFYNGLGTPRQVTAVSASPVYMEDVARMYVEYDPDRANQLLDEIGLTQKNSDGIRLGPDGEPLVLLLEVASSWPYMADEGQVVAEFWQAIGIDAQVQVMERSLWTEKSENNDFDIVVFTAPGTPFLNNWWMFPQWAHNQRAWSDWYASDGAEGEEPPAEVKRAQNLWDTVLVTTDPEEQNEMVREILRLNTENLWSIGLIGEIPQVGVRTLGMNNVPDQAFSSTAVMTPGNANPEQWWKAP